MDEEEREIGRSEQSAPTFEFPQIPRRYFDDRQWTIVRKAIVYEVLGLVCKWVSRLCLLSLVGDHLPIMAQLFLLADRAFSSFYDHGKVEAMASGAALLQRRFLAGPFLYVL